MRPYISNKSFYYQVFGLKSDASIIEVKKAYRLMVKKIHPDLHPPENRDWYKNKMILINEAYHYITKNHSFSYNKNPFINLKRFS